MSKDTETAEFVKINICVILKTFGHDYRSSTGAVSFNLPDFATWLQAELPASTQNSIRSTASLPSPAHPRHCIFLTRLVRLSRQPSSPRIPTSATCYSADHHISRCAHFRQITNDQMVNWIQNLKRCWCCARNHQAEKCDQSTTLSCILSPCAPVFV